MLAGWWWPGGSLSSTHGLTVADGLAVPELFNHQLVHGGEVSANDLLAVLAKVISNTEVLLEVESVHSNPERIHHVGSNHVKSLNTLLASVWSGILPEDRVSVTHVPSTADVLGSINKVVLNHHVQHLHISLHQVLLTLLLMTLQSRTVLLLQEAHHGGGSLSHQTTQVVHFINALLTSEPGLRKLSSS